jgi:hypothetical protein
MVLDEVTVSGKKFLHRQNMVNKSISWQKKAISIVPFTKKFSQHIFSCISCITM